MERVREVIGHELADATISTYTTGYNSYRDWAIRLRLTQWWPASERLLCSWIADKTDPQQKLGPPPLKYATLKVYLAGVNSRLISDGFNGTADMDILKRFMKGLKRQLGQRTTKKKPITIDDLQSLPRDTYDDFIMHGMALVGFYGLLRISELLSDSMIHNNVTFVNDKLARIYLPKSKTDPVRQGDESYSSHSLRQVGAMALARAGCPLHIIQKWGRWKSSAVEEYLQLSTHTFEEYGPRFGSIHPQGDLDTWKISSIWNERTRYFGEESRIL